MPRIIHMFPILYSSIFYLLVPRQKHNVPITVWYSGAKFDLYSSGVFHAKYCTHHSTCCLVPQKPKHNGPMVPNSTSSGQFHAVPGKLTLLTCVNCWTRAKICFCPGFCWNTIRKSLNFLWKYAWYMNKTFGFVLIQDGLTVWILLLPKSVNFFIMPDGHTFWRLSQPDSWCTVSERVGHV